MKNHQDIITPQQGFTIIELLIGMAIMTIIMGAMYGVFVSSSKSQQFNFDATANTQDGRQIIMNISNEVKNATQISSPLAGSVTTTMNYQKNNVLSNWTISLGTGIHANTIIITDPAGNITQRMGIGRTQSLQFIRDSVIPRKITVNLTLRNSARTDAPSTTVSTIIYTLN